MASASAADADNQINGATVAVGAAEDTVDSSDDFIEIGTNDTGETPSGVVLGSAKSNEILTSDDDYDTCDDLNTLIKSTETGQTLTLKNNYNLTKTLTITKNNITIDGGNKIWQLNANQVLISGVDVTLKNINFVNVNRIQNNGGGYAELLYSTVSNSTAPGKFLMDVNYLDHIKIHDIKVSGAATTEDCIIMGTQKVSNVDIYDITYTDATSYRSFIYTDGEFYNITFTRFKVTYVNGNCGLIKSFGCDCYYDNITVDVDGNVSGGSVFDPAASSFTLKNSNIKSTSTTLNFVYNWSNNYAVTLSNNNITCNIIKLTKIAMVDSQDTTWYSPVTLSCLGSSFTNNTFMNNVIIDTDTSTHTDGTYNTFEDCVFNKTTLNGNFNSFINTNFTDFVNNTDNYGFSNVRVNGILQEDKTLDIDKTLYVTNDTTATGDGKSASNPCTLTYATSRIAYGGTIYLLKGTYSEAFTDIVYNIVGYEPEVVIRSTVTQKSPVKISNITFNPLSTSNYLGAKSYSEFESCNFTGNANVFISAQETLNVFKMNNCIFDGCSGNALISYASGTWSMFNCKWNHTTIKNSKVNHFIYASTYLYNDIIDDLRIYDSDLYDIVHYQIATGYDGLTINNLYVNTANLTMINEVTGLNKPGLNINTAELYNINFTGDNLFTFGYLCSFMISYEYTIYPTIDNIVIENLTSTNANNKILRSDINGNTFTNLNFNNVSASKIFDKINDGYANNIVIEGFTVNHSNIANCILSSGTGSTYKGIHIDDVNATNIISLNKQTTLSNGEFTKINGSLIINGDSCKFNNCIFTDCNATSDGFIMVNGEHTRFVSCVFTNNHGTYGGVCNLFKNDTDFKLCTFTAVSNTATIQGGAIYSNETKIYLSFDDQSKANIQDETNVTGPLPNGLYISSRLSTYNVIYIYHGAGNVDIDGTYHTDNMFTAFALINPDGVIYLNGTGENFTYSYDQEASKEGISVYGSDNPINLVMGIRIGEGAFNVTLSGLIFENSTDTALIWNGDDGKIINCTFKHNGYEDNNDGASLGAALQVNGVNLRIINSTFTDNQVKNLGERSNENFGGAIYHNGTKLNIDNCTFSNNFAKNQGSHIYQTSDSVGINIVNSTFKDTNDANTIGGVYLSGVSINVTDCNFTNNTLKNGAGLYIRSVGEAYLEGNEFIDNHATSGAGIYVSNGAVSIVDNTFQGNDATQDGGAIYSVKPLSVSDSTFDDNDAVRNGGAIYAADALNVTGSSFTGNDAVLGGALYLAGSGNVLTDLVLTGNTAVNGSAIYLADNGAVEFKNVTVRDNSHTGADPNAGGDVYIGDNAKYSIPNDDLVLGNGQTIRLGNWKADTIYVNNTKGRFGLGTLTDPLNDLNEAVNHINENGQIILINNGEVYEIDTVQIAALNNITFVGNGVTLKRKTADKFLYILGLYK